MIPQQIHYQNINLPRRIVLARATFDNAQIQMDMGVSLVRAGFKPALTFHDCLLSALLPAGLSERRQQRCVRQPAARQAVAVV